MRSEVVALLALGLLAVAGCAEVSFKRGGNDADLARAQAGCKSERAEGGYEECMRRQGWYVRRAGADATAPGIAADADPRPGAVPQAVQDAKDVRAAQVHGARPGPLPAVVARAQAQDGVLEVASWWRLGLGGDLDADARACAERLGPPHRMEGERRATRAMIGCLRARGWYALTN
ncbi:MAG: hypothetical protein AB7Q97_19290 [Gammaproteobacteria bacterium]